MDRIGLVTIIANALQRSLHPLRRDQAEAAANTVLREFRAFRLRIFRTKDTPRVRPPRSADAPRRFFRKYDDAR